LGKLNSLNKLKLNNNKLCGDIPQSLMNLSIFSLSLGANHLTASDPKLIAWLNDKDSTWAENQTPCPK